MKKTINGKKCPEMQAFSDAKQRCVNSKKSNFKHYGGRGIQFLYKDFEEFIGDVGERPKDGKYSLDRIDNNGNYEPGNCRWVTYIIQAKNRRSSREINTEIKKLKHSQHLRGVSKENKKYRARGYLNGKRIALGCFNTEQEAHRAYLKFELKIRTDWPQKKTKHLRD